MVTYSFFWTIASIVSIFLLPFPLPWFLGIGDVAIIALMGVIFHGFGKYVNNSISSCTELPGPHNWQRPQGASESFFDALARLDPATSESQEACKSFLWKSNPLAFALMGMYATLAGINLLFGLCIFRRSRSGFRSLTQSGLRTQRAICWYFIAATLSLPVGLFRKLPYSLKAPIRYRSRYAWKSFLHAQHMAQHWLKQRLGTRTAFAPSNFVSDSVLPQPPIARFLGIYDILIQVARHSHYGDLLNLSLTSKRVREAIFPVADRAYRLSRLAH
ncbi:hypothetical protein M011DRAFT_469972 [Sporormia fimetaria CBS 119925]|uniref:Uncharacterized protein n=1 Tax=Sporormia fimetaria CBS 119925 TaxID=1340428 RepID=A0A6A6V312_9PLEO|nr:hypothetical protein M011DRAFT_469972 [Sporormia fimetaria CBS 119925]